MENEEPSRDDAAEQKAGSIEYQEKAEQFLKLHRQNKVLSFDTTLLIGLPTVYLLLVTALAGIGVLAFYRHHDTTSDIFLFVSVVLVLLIPISIIWYLVSNFKKKPKADVSRQQGLLAKITRSSVGRFLTWFGHSRIRFLGHLIFIFVIVDSILTFPRHPRSSLAFIVVYLALYFSLSILETLRLLNRVLGAEISEIWEFNKLVQGALGALRDGIIAVSKDQEALAERHHKLVEMFLATNEDTLAAIKAIHHATEVIANPPNPPDDEPPPGNNSD